ncbi:MAG: hypothetical protein U5L98_18565 [Halomonas sp.]|uniref:thiolase family protein n=1 Tax=Halomonas sp. TaxID=1486246 RepID=UPI002ACE39DF|nr:hypothetical protein [Halomonas sp.]MDZ7854569.1 hypothetical protein [Halomonas sp.]
MNPRDVVVVDCARTAMAKAKDGAFRHVRAENLSAAVMQALLDRNPGLDPTEIDDVIWGCVQPDPGAGHATSPAMPRSLDRHAPTACRPRRSTACAARR